MTNTGIVRMGAFALILCSVADVSAEPGISWSGQVRAREEIKHELYSPADPAGEESFDEAHLRTRIRADATVNDQLGAIVELQDVRLFGGEGSTTADTEGVDLKRGAIVITPSGSDTTIKVGRFVMAYGDQRLIGHLEWVDQGRSYDGVQVSYAPEGFFIDGFAIRVRETVAAGGDLNFGGIYGGVNVGAQVLEGYAIGLRDTMGPDTEFATVGSRYALKLPAVDAALEGALQVGSVLDEDHLAAAFAVRATYTIPSSLAVKVGGEIAFASGDGDPADGDSGTFQTLFPTNHIYYGIADLVAWENTLSFRLGGSLKPTTATSISLDLYHHRFADPAAGWFNAGGALVRPGDGDASSLLGHEIDVVAGWKPIPGLAVQGGVGAFIAGGFIDDTGGGDNAVFAYLLLATKFQGSP